MSTTSQPVTTTASQRDDMMLGSTDQDYILRIEPVAPHITDREQRAAALTVRGRLGGRYPDFGRREVVQTARPILRQLGVLDGLFVQARHVRAQAA